MSKMICVALTAAMGCVLLSACAQPPRPVQALPPGPTAEEVADYARAQAQYRYALASGDGDAEIQATNTFLLISEEVLSRQDPPLFDAQIVCRSYRVAGPRNQPGARTTYQPQFLRDCQNIDWRYNQATIGIRRDLEARILAADRQTVAQAAAGHP